MYYNFTLQEAIEYVDHELLVNRFHVTHYGGCAVLFNKDTFFPDVKVKYIYLHDTRRELPEKVMEGDSGWVLQGVLSRASFRRHPLNDQKTFTVLSLRIDNVYAKKRGIGNKLILAIRAAMLKENVDLVAGDFNGAAWRRDNSNNLSIIEEAFADCALPMPPGPTPLWGPGSIPGNWPDVCGIDSGRYGFMVPSPFSVMSWACARMIKAATTKHGSASTLSDDMTCNPSVKKPYQRILLQERSSTYHYGRKSGRISEIMSDHSLSS